MSSPFVNKTPESYFAGLRRKDSKNALTTCHGVTDRGRACRRALSSPKNSSRFDGAVVLTKNVDDPAVFFCWQHKDQADTFSHGEEGSVVSLRGRHSLEDAFRSLGLDDVNEEPEPASKEGSPSAITPPHVDIPEPVFTVAHESRPRSEKSPTYAHVHPRRRRTDQAEKGLLQGRQDRPRRRQSERAPPKVEPAKKSFSLLSCCFGSEPAPRLERARPKEPDTENAPRPVRAYNQQSNASLQANSSSEARLNGHKHQSASRSPRTPAEVRRKEVPSHRRTDSGYAAGTSEYVDPRSNRSHTSSQHLDIQQSSHSKYQVFRDTSPTPGPRRAYQVGGDPKSESLLSVLGPQPLKARSKSTPDAQAFQRMHGEWPPPLPRNATDAMRLIYAKLLTAMSEPPSKTDSLGYIYIFWQTDVEQTEDEASAVATIISAPKLDRGLQRQETILQKRFFQTSANARLPQPEKRTLFLKIGRAVNVHQRLIQWQKQCDYEISLLRSYPYDSNDRSQAKQVPNVVKVERLIHLHLEMLGQRVSKQCRCGTEHKEWFEVDASARGVRDVDEIVRRWTRWSEDRFSDMSTSS